MGRGLVGGDAKGEKSCGPLEGGLDDSQKPCTYEEGFEVHSEGGVLSG